ncbi:MAG: hemolysin family protein, partial [Gemmatimonadales bacterium]
MIWIALGFGLLVAGFGAMTSAALVMVGRHELTRAVSRRLRGGSETVSGRLALLEQHLVAAAAATSFGVVVLGVVIPGMFTGLRVVWMLLLLVFVALPVILFSGYLVPRWLAMPFAERVVAGAVPLLKPWSLLMAPFLPAQPRSNSARLQPVLRGGAAAGFATDPELVMVGGVMTFSDRPAREIMTPRTEIVAIGMNTAVEDIRRVFAESGYSRLPVFRETLDEIAGMLHAFDFFKVGPGDTLPVRPVAVAPASRKCGDLLLDMQRERRHLAVVLDEFGGTLGLVTLEDLLEELVGEIYDEHDEDRSPGGGAGIEFLETDGATPVSAIEERFGVDLPDAAGSIGGLLVGLVGRIPLAGERLRLGALEFDILEASPNRVERILVRPVSTGTVA